MDCEMPQRYVDYPAYQECLQRQGFSDELREPLVEACATEGPKVKLDELKVSSGTYQVMFDCSQIQSGSDASVPEKEADE